MSRGARILLGAAMLLIAVGFASIPWFMSAPFSLNAVCLAMAAFPGCIALACFSDALRPVMVRFIASTVLVISVGYFVSRVLAFQSIEEELDFQEAKPGLINSLLFALVFGAPAVHVAFKGAYPTWGDHALAFGDPPKDEAES